MLLENNQFKLVMGLRYWPLTFVATELLRCISQWMGRTLGAGNGNLIVTHISARKDLSLMGEITPMNSD
jgi:hypothetical protein